MFRTLEEAPDRKVVNPVDGWPRRSWRSSCALTLPFSPLA